MNKLNPCAVCGCENKTASRHRFPNPATHSDRFQQWINLCKNPRLSTLTPVAIYKSHRVCQRHFEPNDLSRNNNLFKNAVPKLYLPGSLSIDLPKDPKHNVSDITIPPPQINHEVTSISSSLLQPLPKINNTSAQKPKGAQDKKVDESLEHIYNILVDESEEQTPCDEDDESLVESPQVVVDLCDDVKNLSNKSPNPSVCSTNRDEATHSQKDTFFLTPENFDSVCRICLKEKDVVHMSENKHEEHTYAEILEMCSTVKLSEDPTLSPHICQTCLDELLQVYNFRQKCTQSEQTLISFKSELEKINKRIMRDKERQKSLTLRFHDYESILSEEDVNNITSQKRQSEDVTPFEDNVKRPYKKRFYLLKGEISGTEGFKGNVNVTEIDETNAKTLMCESHQTAVSLQVGNAICNIKTAVVQPEKDGVKDDTDVPKNSVVIRSRNKRKIIPYSMLLRPAIHSILSGKITNLNSHILRKKKPARKRKRNPDKVSKIRDKKPVIPGICHVCNEPFNTLAEYKQHSTVTKHYLNPYVCESCGKVYPDRHRLKMHKITSHENRKSCMCEICGKCFKTRNYLLIHLKTHRQQKRIACRICGSTFLTRREILYHRRMNHPSIEKKHCCEYCGEFLASPATLRHHRNRVHLKIKHQFCQICGKGYQYKSSLKKHMLAHSTQFTDCKLCNKTFKMEHRYLQHMKNQHPGATEDSKEDDEMRIMECDYCDKVCKNKQSQTMHVREDHEASICLYCDTLFETIEELQNHAEESHPDIPNFSCRYCGRCYVESTALYVHLDTHKPKYYQCNICYKKFANSKRLKIHMVMHTREKMFECNYCEKSFLYSASRVVHERIHTGERPYVCDICGKGNICISSYKRHRRTHIMPVLQSEDREKIEAIASI